MPSAIFFDGTATPPNPRRGLPAAVPQNHQHMTATFINGNRIADDVKREAAAEVEALKARGIHPGLAVILVGEDAASSAYVNMKAKTCEQLGIYSRKLTIPSSVTTDQLVADVRKLNEDDAIDG